MNANKSELLAEIFGPQGYSTAFGISADELQFLRDAIFGQWIARIEDQCPEHAQAFRAGGLEQYHRLTHLVSHESLWTKDHRVLAREAASALTRFDFVRRLGAEFGEVKISDVIFFTGSIPDYPEIYWRLVRPGMPTDVGALHIDKWFHDILGGGSSLYGDNCVTVKMWLAVVTEPGLNGLYVVPGSHRKEWKVAHNIGLDGYARPALDEPLGNYDTQLVRTAPGQAILFNEKLLHGGAPNAGTNCRVSVEITFILQRSAITG